MASNAKGERHELRNSLLKAFSTIGLILTLWTTMSAWGGSENWKEEVQLSDGRTIVVDLSG